MFFPNWLFDKKVLIYPLNVLRYLPIPRYPLKTIFAIFKIWIIKIRYTGMFLNHYNIIILEHFTVWIRGNNVIWKLFVFSIILLSVYHFYPRATRQLLSMDMSIRVWCVTVGKSSKRRSDDTLMYWAFHTGRCKIIDEINIWSRRKHTFEIKM